MVVSPGSSHAAAYHPPHLENNHNNPIVDNSNRMLCWVYYYVHSRLLALPVVRNDYISWIFVNVVLAQQEQICGTRRTSRKLATIERNHQKRFCGVVMLKLTLERTNSFHHNRERQHCYNTHLHLPSRQLLVLQDTRRYLALHYSRLIDWLSGHCIPRWKG